MSPGCATDRPLIDQPAVGAPSVRLSIPWVSGSAIDATPTNVVLRIELLKQPADPDTVTPENVRVDCGGRITAGVSWDARLREIVIVPVADLPADTDCVVVLGPDFSTAAHPVFPEELPGVRLGEELHLAFRTGAGPDNEPPTFDATPELVVCGDGVCGKSEVCSSCEADCGACADEATCRDRVALPDNSPFALRFNSGGVTDNSSSEAISEVRFEALVSTVPGVPGQPKLVTHLKAPSSSDYRILGLDADTTYYIVLRAIDMAGNSVDSAELGPVTTRASGVPDFAGVYFFACACFECHDSDELDPPPMLLELDDESSPYDRLVNVPSLQRPNMSLVEPFDASRSYLVLKMLGEAAGSTFGAGFNGMTMPAGVDGGLVECSLSVPSLIAWIDAGAPPPAAFAPIECFF